MKIHVLLVFGLFIGLSLQETFAQCLTSPNGEYPSGVYLPQVCDAATPNEIATDCYAGEYTTVALVAGNGYLFSSSLSTDYITISNDLGTVAYAFGTGPVNYNPTTTGNYRFYLHTNASCGDNQNSRSRIIVCNGTVGCLSGGQYPSTNFVPTNCDGSTANDIATDCYAGEYTAVDLVGGNDYAFQSSNTNDLVTISDASGSVVYAVGFEFANYSPAANETIRFYTHTDLGCGSENVNRIRTVYCLGSSPSGPCTSEPNGMFPANTFTPACTGAFETIDAGCLTGEYSKVYLQNGYLYEFASSNPNDWITLTDETGATPLLFGLGPIVAGQVSGSGILRFYLHSDSLCGVDGAIRSRLVKCTLNVGLSEMNAEDIQIYPNPVSDKISVESSFIFDEIEIISIDGRKLSSVQPFSASTEIMVDNLDRGTYFLRINSNGQLIMKEFVKN